MTDVITDTPKKARILSRITTWTLRIMFAATVLIFLAVIMTAGLGGNGETQRKSLEAMFGGVFGRPVAIHQLNMYQLFPDFKIDLGGMVVMNPDDRVPVAILESGLFVQESLAEMMGKYPVKALAFKNFVTKPLFVGPYSLHLERGDIIAPHDRDTGLFAIVGNYGGYDLTASVPLLATQANDDTWRYRATPDLPMHMDLAGTKIDFQISIQKEKIILNPVTVHGKNGDVVGTAVIPTAGADKNIVFKFTDPATNNWAEGTLLVAGDTVSVTVNDGKNPDLLAPFFATFQNMITHVKQRDETGKLLPKPTLTIALKAP